MKFFERIAAVIGLRKDLPKSVEGQNAHEELIISELTLKTAENLKKVAEIDSSTARLQEELIRKRTELIPEKIFLRALEMKFMIETEELHKQARAGTLKSKDIEIRKLENFSAAEKPQLTDATAGQNEAPAD